jgi:hypothetical protein
LQLLANQLFADTRVEHAITVSDGNFAIVVKYVMSQLKLSTSRGLDLFNEVRHSQLDLRRFVPIHDMRRKILLLALSDCGRDPHDFPY